MACLTSRVKSPVTFYEVRNCMDGQRKPLLCMTGVVWSSTVDGVPGFDLYNDRTSPLVGLHHTSPPLFLSLSNCFGSTSTRLWLQACRRICLYI